MINVDGGLNMKIFTSFFVAQELCKLDSYRLIRS